MRILTNPVALAELRVTFRQREGVAVLTIKAKQAQIDDGVLSLQDQQETWSYFNWDTILSIRTLSEELLPEEPEPDEPEPDEPEPEEPPPPSTPDLVEDLVNVLRQLDPQYRERVQAALDELKANNSD
jgi:hypothetical protein